MILWSFLKKEIIALLRDPVMLAAIMIMPMIQVVVLSQAITTEARNLRLAVDTKADDYALNRIYDHALGSGWFIKVPPLQEDAAAAVQSGKADVAIVAPAGGLTKSIERGEGRLQVLIDATNVLKAQSIEAYLQGVVSHVMTEEMHTIPVQPIIFQTRILFNPQLDTQQFIIPAILAILVLMSLLTLTCVSITREKENGTIETLISAPISKYDIILGKTIPYILVALINMFLIQSIGILLFNLPFQGSFLMFMAAFAVFCIPSSAAAVLLSTYTKTQQQAMLGMIIVLFLSLMLSGALFPVENMPLILQYVAELNPLMHFTYLVRNIILKGAGWAYFWEHALVMLGVGMVIAFFAARRFKTTL